jgi:arylsulfatase A-like enzyme
MMGCEGNPVVQTPNLDQLAEDGIHFTNAHVTSAICTPSRVSILLSQFERKHGVNFNSGTSVAPEAWEKSYPVLMREAGYYTGYVGKNHAPIGDGGYQSGLMEQSFDYFYAGHGHLSFYPKQRHKIFQQAQSNTQVEIIEEGVHDFLGGNQERLEGALQFLDRRPQDQPFCLSICFNLPHGAGTGTMELRDDDPEIYKSRYRELEIPLPANYIAKSDIDEPKLPATLLKTENRQQSYDWVDTPEKVRERTIRMYQAVSGIDRMVGDLRTRLKALNLEQNTVIIFSSDHGLFSGQYGLGGKALCYEAVTRVPMIIYHPQAAEEVKGKQVDELVQSIDIAPTMLSLAGIMLPNTFQGKDLSAILRGDKVSVRDYLYTENLWSTQFGNPRCESVQDREWKYIRYYQNHNIPAAQKIDIAQQLGIPLTNMLYAVHDPDIALYRHYVEASLQGEAAVYEELYHLKEDPWETVNLIDHPQYIDKLQELRQVWESEITAARGEGPPAVLRYTADSKYESDKMK